MPQHPDVAAVQDFVRKHESATRYVRDAIASAVNRQELKADERGHKHLEKYAAEDRALLSTAGIQPSLLTHLDTSKLAPRYIGQF